MPIDFVVEDNTGLSNATSYITVAEMDQYWLNRDYDMGVLTEENKQRLLNSSTSYIDNVYRGSFPGYRTVETQSLEWGRTSAYYIDGYDIAEGVVPIEIKNAVNELSFLINSGEDVEAIISKSGKILKESSQVDVIKEAFTYEEGSSFYSDIYTTVDNALSRITGGTSGNFQLSVIRVGGESA